MRDTKEKIKEFINLKPGWHMEDIKGMNQESIDYALEILEYIESLGQEEHDAFPGWDGMIQITVYPSKELTFEIDIDAKDEFDLSLYKEPTNNQPYEDIFYQEDMTLEQFKVKFEELLKVYC